MRGYPSSLNSWEDVIFVTENFPKSMWQADLERLISDDETKAWYWVELLPVGKQGIVDDTHKVVEYDDHNNETEGTASTDGKTSGKDTNEIQYVQYELRYNLLCRLAQMKFCHSDEELVAAISDVQNLLEVNNAAETATATKTTKKNKSK